MSNYLKIHPILRLIIALGSTIILSTFVLLFVYKELNNKYLARIQIDTYHNFKNYRHHLSELEKINKYTEYLAKHNATDKIIQTLIDSYTLYLTKNIKDNRLMFSSCVNIRRSSGVGSVQLSREETGLFKGRVNLNSFASLLITIIYKNTEKNLAFSCYEEIKRDVEIFNNEFKKIHNIDIISIGQPSTELYRPISKLKFFFILNIISLFIFGIIERKALLTIFKKF